MSRQEGAIQDEMTRVVHGYRRVLEKSWSPDTRHPNCNRLKGVPLSCGQCVVASCVILPRLQRQFPQESIGIETGIVWRAGLGDTALTPVIGGEKHTWIDWQRTGFYNVSVIDMTADQATDEYLRSQPTVVATRRTLREEGLVYETYRHFGDAHELLAYEDRYGGDPEALRARLELLEDNFCRQLAILGEQAIGNA